MTTATETLLTAFDEDYIAMTSLANGDELTLLENLLVRKLVYLGWLHGEKHALERANEMTTNYGPCSVCRREQGQTYHTHPCE